MVISNFTKINFTNKFNKTIEIWIEPEAESIELMQNKTANFLINSYESEALVIHFHEDAVVVFNNSETKLEISIDNKLVFSSSLGKNT